MSVQIVRPPQPLPEALTRSVFLSGPLPEDASDANWHTQAVDALEQAGFEGTLFVPLPRGGPRPRDADHAAWSRQCLSLADVVAFWWPRDPGTASDRVAHVQFGEMLHSGRLLYGRPDGAPHTQHLDARYCAVNATQKAPFDAPCRTLGQLAEQCVARLGAGARREGGQRAVPLSVWRSSQFQAWHQELTTAGNRLDDAQVLWTFHIPQADHFLLCYALKVNVWVAAEQRHKENEFIVSRTDIVSICAYRPDSATHDMLDTRVVLVKEFRSPARTADGFLHDLPGGSSFYASADQALDVAADELEAETSLQVAASRFRKVTQRQMAGTLGTHKAHLFAVELTADEMRHAEGLERAAPFGVAAETEKTYVEVRTVRQILGDRLLDHATVGMVLQACLNRPLAEP